MILIGRGLDLVAREGVVSWKARKQKPRSGGSESANLCGFEGAEGAEAPSDCGSGDAKGIQEAVRWPI